MSNGDEVMLIASVTNAAANPPSHEATDPPRLTLLDRDQSRLTLACRDNAILESTSRKLSQDR